MREGTERQVRAVGVRTNEREGARNKGRDMVQMYGQVNGRDAGAARVVEAKASRHRGSSWWPDCGSAEAHARHVERGEKPCRICAQEEAVERKEAAGLARRARQLEALLARNAAANERRAAAAAIRRAQRAQAKLDEASS